MITLGVNAAFHDSAAALVIDGIVIAAAEEERFSRIKHGKRPVPFSAWELPFGAIDYCLAEAGATLDDVDHVAYSLDPACFLGQCAEPLESIVLPLGAQRPAGGAWESPWDPLFVAYVMNAPRQLVDGVPHHLRRRFASKGAAAHFQWHFINHHCCHQASAFLAAPYDRCAVMTLDGRGEKATTSYGVYRNNSYRALGEVNVPHSLGILYERVTTHLGFLHSSDEYKVMALAAMGSARFADILRAAVRVEEEGRFTVAEIDMPAAFGPQRIPGSPLRQEHFDLAASLQLVLEETVLQLATWLRQASGESRLAMAGGVALNCLMNSRLRDSGIFDAVWVQPAAGDAGTALGAALWVDGRERRQPKSVATAMTETASPGPSASGERRPRRLEDEGELALDEREEAALQASAALPAGPVAAGLVDEVAGTLLFAPRHWQMQHVYLGPGFADEEIEHLLRWAKLSYRKLDDVAAATARLLAENRIVGWFQGRMEWGPRALGARSILASPIDPAMQARMNELKDREDFRPVAPVLPEEDLADWFAPAAANGGTSPFMLFVYDTQPAQAARIPSACHADRTARVQTVNAELNPRYHALLRAFGELTGVPVLINTSFNVRGQPVVCSPRDALEAFFSTPLDALVIGSFLLEKGERS